MSEGPAFRGAPRSGGGSDGLVAALVGVLLVAFVGIAIAKPWGGPPTTPATASTAPSGLEGEVAATSGPEATEPAIPAPSPLSMRSADQAFTTPGPPPPTATWTGLRWRRLAPDDPLGLVRSVLRWRGGYVATGLVESSSILATPVWTSPDGIRWDPLPFGAASTFWPDAIILGLAAAPAGLVAISEQLGGDCPVCAPLNRPVVAWTSPDGRTWQPRPLTGGWAPGPLGTGPLTAAGPAGILVASSGPAAHLLASPDGASWRPLPARTLPPDFVLDDLKGTSTGYLAAGRWLGGATGRAATLWSADGARWSSMPTVLGAPDLPATAGSAVDTLVLGPRGAVAVGHSVTVPGATLWWQSSDDRDWHPLTGYPPLGSWSPSGAAVRSGPFGSLVGDGLRLLAVRGGPSAAAWVSADGLGWRRLSVSGDVPSAHAADATLLPAGVLLTDGSTAWFGEAVTG